MNIKTVRYQSNIKDDYSSRVSCFFLFFFMMLFVMNVEANEKVIRLATTTSTVNSGLMEVLIPAFESQTNYKIKLFVTGTGNALLRARTGEADLTITHSPKAELKLVNDGFGKERKPLMKNEFVLVGPGGDPAGIVGTGSIIVALQKIAEKKAVFVSRGDDSGTHKKELLAWEKAGIEPYGEWYIETGEGMGNTLDYASGQNAYTLTDSGTWLARKQNLKLKVLLSGDELLANPYSVILVEPTKHPSVNYKGAQAFMAWLLSSEGQDLIRNYKVSGQQLFFPVNGE